MRVCTISNIIVNSFISGIPIKVFTVSSKLCSGRVRNIQKFSNSHNIIILQTVEYWVAYLIRQVLGVICEFRRKRVSHKYQFTIDEISVVRHLMYTVHIIHYLNCLYD